MTERRQPRTTKAQRQDEVLSLLRECGTAMHALGSRFAERADIHPTDLQALDQLARRGRNAPTAGELGAALELSSAAVTGLVDRLEASGHVERVGDPGDRRRVRVQMTPRAHSLAQEVFQTYGSRLRAALDGFTDDELRTVAAFLRAAVQAAESDS